MNETEIRITALKIAVEFGVGKGLTHSEVLEAARSFEDYVRERRQPPPLAQRDPLTGMTHLVGGWHV